LLIAQEKERKNLESDKKTKTELVAILSQKEDSLNERIEQKQVQMAKLNAAIRTAIAREIEAERKRREREAARSKKTGTAPIAKAPVTSEISNSFKTSRGRLPWPVSQGYVSQTFGVHRHPEFKNITLQNNGIDITTQAGQNVTAVFKGTVSAILSIPGEGEAVLINHGDYFSVYSRMGSTSVSKGQKVALGDVLGKVMTDDDGKAVLQFQIWSGQEKQNPENWLKGR
jgi:septal ring factor EnvC (AmiA/AmiB activator)